MTTYKITLNDLKDGIRKYYYENEYINKEWRVIINVYLFKWLNYFITIIFIIT